MIPLYALHGMFGQPTDWDFLEGDIHKVDLFAEPPLRFWRWATDFNNALIRSKSPLGIIIGYSLGARLAMHALLQNPYLYRGAVLISGHMGLKTQDERSERIQNDLEWARRFKTMEWNALLEAWNKQPSLQGSSKTPRQESDFSRKRLTQALLKWSLALQDNVQDLMENLDIPLLIVTGADDKKYTHLANALSLRHPLSRHWICPNAAHRVPWDQPALFKAHLNTFIEDLYASTNSSLAGRQNIPRHSLSKN